MPPQTRTRLLQVAGEKADQLKRQTKAKKTDKKLNKAKKEGKAAKNKFKGIRIRKGVRIKVSLSSCAAMLKQKLPQHVGSQHKLHSSWCLHFDSLTCVYISFLSRGSQCSSRAVSNHSSVTKFKKFMHCASSFCCAVSCSGHQGHRR